MEGLEWVKCNLCGRDNAKYLFRKRSFFQDKSYFDVVKCRNCGLIFVNPRPTEKALSNLYSKAYFVEADGLQGGYQDYLKDRDIILNEVNLNFRDISFKQIEESLGGRKCLEVGCAARFFLEFMHERGWEVCGMDISEYVSQMARQRTGLNIITGTIFDANLPSTDFDLVTMWYLIEHVHDPKGVLLEVNRVLRDQGALILTCPRVGGMNAMQLFGKNWRLYRVPEHLYYFSRTTIRRILNETGFEVRNIVTFGSGLSTGRSNMKIKRMADKMVKRFNIGDTMLVYARKRNP
jgi:2-polyprenyl-3-methyl-5-hydroxy-6-metoxy-1,4-benzoquinol methylase